MFPWSIVGLRRFFAFPCVSVSNDVSSSQLVPCIAGERAELSRKAESSFAILSSAEWAADRSSSAIPLQWHKVIRSQQPAQLRIVPDAPVASLSIAMIMSISISASRSYQCQHNPSPVLIALVSYAIEPQYQPAKPKILFAQFSSPRSVPILHSLHRGPSTSSRAITITITNEIHTFPSATRPVAGSDRR